VFSPYQSIFLHMLARPAILSPSFLLALYTQQCS